MKQITIIGNIGANAVVRTTSDGRQLMSFNVAVNQPNGDPLWFNCIGNYREKLLPYLVKGQTICVIGDLGIGMYNGRIDVQINIDRCELCGAKPQDHSQSSAPKNTPADEEQTINETY